MTNSASDLSDINRLLGAIDDVGRDRANGGWSRHLFDGAERELRTWFTEEAGRRGLAVETDRNANLWAWWPEPGPDAVVTGSHLDSVPGGGPYDGPLGIAAAFAAVGRLRERGFVPERPLAIVAFAEEEGTRFGLPCLGSGLMTGSINADLARRARDSEGTTLADAVAAAGLAPSELGADPQTLGRIGRFVELHVEQGRALADRDRPLAIAGSILGHGRWRFGFRGQGNHAGATGMDDRSDPALPAAELVLAARRIAKSVPGARATVGRLHPRPGGTNVIASAVDAWLDARAATDTQVRGLVEQISAAAEHAAAEEGCSLDVVEESFAEAVHLDSALSWRLGATIGDVPRLDSGAGHDAGVLCGHVPTAMMFVRNPTGVSHSPEEWAEPDDRAAGAAALADVLAELAGPTEV
ncbi:allantoate amidohydrolase [Streptomonospora wellingtoniae]|uniref:Allantoate amidohydrolase n=1 Tax=Streptomonospora wellingtoniae TaxID=3075544 RepID=A0ABU2KYC2_9ACTN|nr:allantoate amidohydrolase [Streptomonospora sp. DSM 45055]MDT0304248.1 allantoate amidohydrolase [Streptomonospora sp. DSM 45055]